MTMADLTRRAFLKIGAAGGGAATLASGLTTEWWGLDGSEVPDPGTDGDRVVPTFCDICFWQCGALAHVRGGRVTKITGNPRHPLSRGRLCPRGIGGTGLLYDPDRLKRPLIRRRAARGSEEFEEATWDEALDTVATGLRRLRDRHGPEALAMYYHGMGGAWFKPLLHGLGTANVAAPSYAQCRGPREEGYRTTIGRDMGSHEPVDIAHARCLVLIGSHLGENMHNTQVQDFADAIGRGLDLVVVDPRFSVAASKARHWLPIKPGTDIALLLAWMHVLIDERLYDSDYVARLTVGFDQLREHVRDRTPEWAAVRTGLDPRLIRDSARTIGAARPASLVHPGRRATWYGDDTQRSRAMAILAALLGSFGRRGGYLQPAATSLPAYPLPPFEREPRAPADHPRGTAYPLATEVLASGLRDASIPGTAEYDIKGWLVYGTNLVQSVPQPARTREAIQRLDFIVSIDVLPSEICGWSDVVLPECTYLERYDDLRAPAWEQPFVALRQPAIDPMFDSRPGWWIARELARRLDLSRYYPWDDARGYLRQRASDAGVAWTELLEHGVVLGAHEPACEEDGLAPSFGTPSGKIELFSEALAAMGAEPLPEFRMPPQPPPGQLRLITGRSPVHTFGRTTNNRFLATCDDRNEAWVNPSTARSLPGFEARPLESGDLVTLVNQDGVRSDPIEARVTERVRGDVVYVVHGFGHSARGLTFAHGRGASTSELSTGVAVDPLMGSPGYNVNFVRIERQEA
jgi:thiosulfate reductase/polysulfide reductase chain A